MTTEIIMEEIVGFAENAYAKLKAAKVDLIIVGDKVEILSLLYL
jgi:uncharacterized membrane protein (Fun14 family)